MFYFLVLIQYSINLVEMFQNSYQNGTFFELFDPKRTNGPISVSQDKLKTLYRTSNVNGTIKVFDKELKTFVMEFGSPNARMILPKEEKKDLYLIQQYLILQIYFYQGLSWNIELVVSDLTKTKRRIVLSPATSKTQVKPFFVKTPCHGYTEGVWNNFMVDLYSFMEAFKGQTYRSLDSIYITGHFKLRRIYTASIVPYETNEQGHQHEGNHINFLPKHYYFPIDVPSVAKINKYTYDVINANTSMITDHSTKNSSFLKSTKPKIAHIKINKCEQLIKCHDKTEVDSKKIKKFLSNTNSQSLSTKDIHTLQDQKQPMKSIKVEQQKHASKSGDKLIKRRHLIKTQQVPIKNQQINDRQITKKPQTNGKITVKLNPWRSNKKQPILAKELSQQLPKQGSDRNTDTPETVSIFNCKNNLHSKFSQTKNNNFQSKCEQYSDSQYFELSQKFSTLTDGKFFKNQLANMTRNHIQIEVKHSEEEEIEENIEMEANSMQSSANKKVEQAKHDEQEIIRESICGGKMNKAQSKIYEQKYEQLARSSLYGFGQQLMKHYMEQVDRPYSPPLMQKQMTEEQLTPNCHHDEKEEVQLIYDPVLNCYYDHRTHTYYELKN